MSEITVLPFLHHLGDAAIRQDVPGVDQTIQHFGGLFDEIRLIRVLFQLVI